MHLWEIDGHQQSDMNTLIWSIIFHIEEHHKNSRARIRSYYLFISISEYIFAYFLWYWMVHLCYGLLLHHLVWYYQFVSLSLQNTNTASYWLSSLRVHGGVVVVFILGWFPWRIYGGWMNTIYTCAMIGWLSIIFLRLSFGWQDADVVHKYIAGEEWC